MTVNSGASAYATPADLLARYDARQLGDYCTDTDTRVPAAALPTDPNVAAALATASGWVESACLKGQRYQPADLAALQASTTVGAAFLVDLTCALAVWFLYRRRRFDAEPPPAAKQALEALARVESGEAVFGLLEAQAAGVGTETVSQYPTQADIDRSILGRSRRMWGGHGTLPGTLGY